jgi:hypothetical protein
VKCKRGRRGLRNFRSQHKWRTLGTKKPLTLEDSTGLVQLLVEERSSTSKRVIQRFGQPDVAFLACLVRPRGVLRPSPPTQIISSLPYPDPATLSAWPYPLCGVPHQHLWRFSASCFAADTGDRLRGRLMGKKALTTSAPQAWRRVFTESVKDIVLLNERRIPLTELNIRLQVRTSSPLPAPCTSSTRCWRKGDEA